MTSSGRAVVLLSGGLDSATLLALARDERLAIHALSFRYGQRHAVELSAAADLARHFGVIEHVVLDLDLRKLGGSALTSDRPVPKNGAALASGEIPVTYVPARNTIFLSIALGLAEVREASEIWIGVNAVDYSGYPDCRPEYLRAFEALAGLATRAGVVGHAIRVRAPLLTLHKHEIVRAGLALGVDYSMTRSCYDPNDAGEACGACDSCRLRLAAFERAGARDPAPYR